MTPSQFTRNKLKKDGWIPWTVEVFNYFSGKKRDLFDVMDIIALKPGEKGILGVQATSRGNISTRLKKIYASEYWKLWLEVGNRLEVWGWDKFENRWRVKIVVIGMDDAKTLKTSFSHA